MEEVNVGTREYFIQEICRFRELMGLKSFWDDLEKTKRAYYGLAYVFANTKDLTKEDGISMQAVSEEYDRRLILVLLYHKTFKEETHGRNQR